MKRSRSMLLTCLLVPAVLASACSSGPDGTSGDTGDLTSVGGVVRQLDWDAFVYVAPDADDASIARTIARQIKSALGALRERGVGIADREAQQNLDPAGWQRDRLTIIDAAGAPAGTLTRVRYHYRDTALVDRRKDPGAALAFTLMFGDYIARSADYQPACVDEATEADSLWYHFSPAQAACATRIATETRSLNDALARLADPTGQVSAVDAARRFLPVRAKLTPQADAPTRFPEYDRLWGFGSDRSKVVMYAFIGVDHDLRDSHDLGAIEYQRLLRTLRARFPRLAVTETRPQAWLLDFWIDGRKLDGVSFDDVSRWMIDGAGYPTAVGSDPAKIEALRQQVIDRFAERWITLSMPVTVTLGAETRRMTVELRTYWGLEDGDPTSRQHAQWRYLEAFWHGDVFAYAGHSHFGHGPLEPTAYRRENFPERYQVMLVNSCLSYNYYDLDFIRMHPNGSRDLEVVMNALPAYWSGMGESTALYLSGLIDGTNKSWAQLLEGMKVKDPWGRAGYEPMRGVNGELDNVYDPVRLAVTVRVE